MVILSCEVVDANFSLFAAVIKAVVWLDYFGNLIVTVVIIHIEGFSLLMLPALQMGLF